MNKYKEAAEILNSMAEVKMAMNNHKGKIEDAAHQSIMSALDNELEELSEALSDQDMIHIIEEAADVQNFLLALVQQQLNKYRSRK